MQGKWALYEEEKRQIDAQNLSYAEREKALRDLARKLKI